MRKTSFSYCIFIATCLLFFSSCEKLLEIPPPISSITTEEIFATNKQAEWAMSGVYTKMINGAHLMPAEIESIAYRLFSGGLSTLQGALSADELTTNVDLSSSDRFSQLNKLTIENCDKTNELWYSAYRTIFDANALIEGIAASTSSLLIDSVKKQLTGEALAIRAFSYFYLVNFFGELPLVLTSNFQKTVSLSRLPVSKVYDQIKADLIKARSLLANDFSVSNNQRIRVNKWFAEALLARVYLFTGEYQAAINSATAVINHTELFVLEQDLNNTFLPNNTEAIFQLMPSFVSSNIKDGTPEGFVFNQVALIEGQYNNRYNLNEELVAAFEVNDKRKTIWTLAKGGQSIPFKYREGNRSEYLTVMRLAELFLIRSEATVLLMPSAKNNAIDDLNILRRRAGVNELGYQLTAAQVIEAIAHERRVELFLEWGHRWFDLKRTGKANEVLSSISYKQPWLGDYQLLYPVPKAEITLNGQLVQNPEYDFR